MTFFNSLFSIRPERFFLFTGGFFGLLFLLLTPPIQVPDEPCHFYRAYQLSQGQLLSVKEDNRVGGMLPSSVNIAADPAFGYMCWSTQIHTNCKTILGTLKNPLNPDKREFFDFPNTAMYAPVCYAPQALGIFTARLFYASPVALLYMGRFFALLFWLIVMYQAIRLAPLYKWLFTFAALLPMSVYINMTLSADVVTNAVSFFSLAFILKLAYEGEALTQKKFLWLCLICFLQVSVKLVYAPILLALFIIPPHAFKSRRDQVIKLSLLILVSLGTAVLWSAASKGLYTAYEFYNPAFRDDKPLIKTADMYRQMDYIGSHGTYILKVFSNSLKVAFGMYSHGYIGVFGWLDTVPPDWFMKSMYLIIVFLLFTDGGTLSVRWWHRLLFFAGLALSVAALLLSQHLTWDPVGGDAVYTIQGRYLIPFAPLAFPLFYTPLRAKKTAMLVVMLSCLLSLSYCAFLLHARYFG